jgi:hypothetical protein
VTTRDLNSVILGTIFYAALFQAVGFTLGGVTLPVYAIWMPMSLLGLMAVLLLNFKLVKPKKGVVLLNCAFFILPICVVLGMLGVVQPSTSSFSFFRAENIVSQSLYAVTYSALIIVASVVTFNEGLLLRMFHGSNLVLIFLVLDELLYKYAGFGIYPLLHHGDFRIQHTHQIVGGMVRITGPFYEASILGGYASAVFGFYMVRFVFYKGRFNLIISIVFFLMTMRALSSTGFVGVFCALMLVGYFSVFRAERGMPYKILIICLVAIGVLMASYFGNEMGMLAGKQGSESWNIRVGLDLDAIKALPENIMGFQYGSVRTSSLLVNILANTGLFFGLFFWVFIALAIYSGRRLPLFSWHFFVLVLATHVLSIPDIGQPELVSAALLYVLNWRVMHSQTSLS